MPLPASYAKDGFIAPEQCFNISRQLMIGSEGGADTGKTEFGLSAPGRIMMICLDRGLKGVYTNPHPPKTRNKNVAIKVIAIPTLTQSNDPKFYKEYWRDFYDNGYLKALRNPECDVVLLDGDSDSWELQRLAEWATTTNVPGPPGMAYTGVNAARRAMYNRAWDSKKIFIATNKLHKKYTPVLDARGFPVKNKEGRIEKEWDGSNYESQGFSDTEYLWDIWLRHLYKPPYFNEKLKKEVPGKFGIRIVRCKHDTSLIGLELWGDDCCFAGLVQTVYPNITLKQWGF